MARKPSKTLTERELEIMHVLWELGEAPLGEVQEALNRRGEPVAPSTVATQLGILVQKGFVTQTGRPGRSLYVPAWSKEEATRNLLDDFLARVGLGRSPGFLIQLLKAEKLSAQDRATLQEILREQAPEPGRRPRSRPAEPPAGGEAAS
jgi:BlaI family transcriptional regulator, penicillinase repressor